MAATLPVLIGCYKLPKLFLHKYAMIKNTAVAFLCSMHIGAHSRKNAHLWFFWTTKEKITSLHSSGCMVCDGPVINSLCYACVCLCDFSTIILMYMVGNLLIIARSSILTQRRRTRPINSNLMFQNGLMTFHSLHV